MVPQCSEFITSLKVTNTLNKKTESETSNKLHNKIYIQKHIYQLILDIGDKKLDRVAPLKTDLPLTSFTNLSEKRKKKKKLHRRHDMSQMTHDRWLGVNILLKC